MIMWAGVLLVRGVSARRCAMIAVAMDESGSMSGEQEWFYGEVATIFASIDALGFDNKMLCASGFGGNYW